MLCCTVWKADRAPLRLQQYSSQPAEMAAITVRKQEEKSEKEAADETRERTTNMRSSYRQSKKKKGRRERESQGNASVRNEELKSLAGIRDA